MPKYHRAMNAFIGNHGAVIRIATDRGEAVHALAEIAGVAEIEGAVMPVRPPHPAAELDVPGQDLGVDLLALGQPEAARSARTTSSSPPRIARSARRLHSHSRSV